MSELILHTTEDGLAAFPSSGGVLWKGGVVASTSTPPPRPATPSTPPREGNVTPPTPPQEGNE